MSPQEIKALKKLPNMGELVIEGVLWTKFADFREFKISPKGTEGDFDTDCYWIAFEDVYGDAQ